MSMIQKTSTLIIRKLLCPPYYEYENILQVMDEKNVVIVKIHEYISDETLSETAPLSRFVWCVVWSFSVIENRRQCSLRR